MALEVMHDVMIQRLRESGATGGQIDLYERLWKTAVAANRTGEPIPCPVQATAVWLTSRSTTTC